MLILSFDVGIKNLSYCLFDYNKNENTDISCTIFEWDVIDLSTKDIVKCMYNDCTNKITYYRKTHYYCKKHAKESKFIIQENANSLPTKQSKKNDLLYFCKTHFIPYKETMKKNELYSLIENYKNTLCLNRYTSKKTNTISLIDIGINIQYHFNLLFNKYKIDIILIENQISPIANRMKTIQGMIAQYFIMNSIYSIHFISAKNKLKPFLEYNQKTNYKERKQLSITITNNYIKDTKWSETFLRHKKKDDLADSFLQGLWYIKEKI